MQRKSFLKRLTLGGTALFTGLYTWQFEPFWLEFVQKLMPIKHLPDELVGKTLMQISDIHIGDRVNTQYLIDSLKKAAAFAPDFVVYTGDFVSYKSYKHLEQLQEMLPHFVEGKLGTLGVLGNHDYGKKWSESEVAHNIASALSQKNIQILRNEQKTVHGLTFIGIDELWGTNFHPHKAMENWQPNTANLVLCHNPDVADMPVWNKYDGWILSGHTHGGQVRPPFLPPPIVPVKNRKYTAGQFDLKDGRTLYINRALGYMFQVRCNVRPEITLFQLVKC